MIYFALLPDTLIKIGFTRAIRQRLRMLEVQYGKPILLLGMMRGHRKIERQIHQQFAEFRLKPKDERFEQADPILEFIRENTTLVSHGRTRTEQVTGSIDPKKWLTASEALKLLECSRESVIRLARRGIIRSRKTREHKRYLRADVDKLLAAEAEAKQTA